MKLLKKWMGMQVTWLMCSMREETDKLKEIWLKIVIEASAGISRT